MQTKICAVFGEGAVTDWSHVSKVVCEVSRQRYFAINAPQLGRPVEVDSNQIETLIGNNQGYTTLRDSQHSENIQIKRWKSFAPALLC